MAGVEKPAEGSWTEHYPELGTGPVSYEDSISPGFFELEREAIFKRAWLEVGRVEQLPRQGSFFTKEIAVARTLCKYHGWRYGLDGACTYVQQEGEFFDLDKARYGLVPVHCDVWAGFIFIDLEPEPRQGLEEFLGPMIGALEGYPFHRMTERFYYRSEVGANWKLFMDAFQEFCHAPVLHGKQSPVGACPTSRRRIV